MSGFERRASTDRLDAEQRAELRPTLPEWEWGADVIRRSVTAPTFLDGIDFVRRVADDAEARDHHPDIDIRWRTVHIALTTHSAGGLTDLDVAAAAAIDAIIASQPW